MASIESEPSPEQAGADMAGTTVGGADIAQQWSVTYGAELRALAQSLAQRHQGGLLMLQLAAGQRRRWRHILRARFGMRARYRDGGAELRLSATRARRASGFTAAELNAILRATAWLRHWDAAYIAGVHAAARLVRAGVSSPDLDIEVIRAAATVLKRFPLSVRRGRWSTTPSAEARELVLVGRFATQLVLSSLSSGARPICKRCRRAPAYLGIALLGSCIECFRHNAEPSYLRDRYEDHVQASASMPRRLQELGDEALRAANRFLDPLLEQHAAHVAALNAELDVIEQDHGRWPGKTPDLVKKIQSISAILDAFVIAPHEFVSLAPSNPTQVLFTAVPDRVTVLPTFKRDRIYLDVTDSTLEQVREIWTEVDWYQGELRESGRSGKQAQGKPRGPRRPETRRWVARALEVGEKAARDEYRNEIQGRRDEWQDAYQWWARNVRRHLPKSR